MVQRPRSRCGQCHGYPLLADVCGGDHSRVGVGTSSDEAGVGEHPCIGGHGLSSHHHSELHVATWCGACECVGCQCVSRTWASVRFCGPATRRSTEVFRLLIGVHYSVLFPHDCRKRFERLERSDCCPRPLCMSGWHHTGRRETSIKSDHQRRLRAQFSFVAPVRHAPSSG